MVSLRAFRFRYGLVKSIPSLVSENHHGTVHLLVSCSDLTFWLLPKCLILTPLARLHMQSTIFTSTYSPSNPSPNPVKISLCAMLPRNRASGPRDVKKKSDRTNATDSVTFYISAYQHQIKLQSWTYILTPLD